MWSNGNVHMSRPRPQSVTAWVERQRRRGLYRDGESLQCTDRPLIPMPNTSAMPITMSSRPEFVVNVPSPTARETIRNKNASTPMTAPIMAQRTFGLDWSRTGTWQRVEEIFLVATDRSVRIYTCGKGCSTESFPDGAALCYTHRHLLDNCVAAAGAGEVGWRTW